jgi:hypothetical protein
MSIIGIGFRGTGGAKSILQFIEECFIALDPAFSEINQVKSLTILTEKSLWDLIVNQGYGAQMITKLICVFIYEYPESS